MHGFVETIRGRHGGLRLDRELGQIGIGDVIRQTETDRTMAACFAAEDPACRYSASCALKEAFGRATAAFFAVLDELTLDSLKPATPGARAIHLYRSGTIVREPPQAGAADRPE